MFIKGKCAIYIDKNLRVYENSTVIFVLCPRQIQCFKFGGFTVLYTCMNYLQCEGEKLVNTKNIIILQIFSSKNPFLSFLFFTTLYNKSVKDQVEITDILLGNFNITKPAVPTQTLDRQILDMINIRHNQRLLCIWFVIS